MAADPAWTLSIGEDGIARLVLDRPGASANTLSRDVLLQLSEQLRPLEARPPRGLIVASGKRNGFIAGADVKEFTSFTDADKAYAIVREAQQIFDRLEALPCPTVAVIEGFALGGGLELALACRYRVAVDDPRVTLGLPEVQLGIHPGFGGTVRSVRLLGVRRAMDLMLTGKSVRAERALQIGLVDALVPASQLDAAARELIEDRPPTQRPPFFDRLLSNALVRPLLRPALLRQVARRVRREHYPAPYAIVDLWAQYGGKGRKAAEAEARSIARLFGTPTARNLIRVFFLQDRLKALGSAAAARPGAQAVQRVHVVGAGVMGGDIAAWCALRGLDVTLQDRSEEQVAPALRRAEALFEKRLRSADDIAAAKGRLRADVAGAGVARANVLIEAIFEDLTAKRALYARTEPQLAADALLASNTSSIMLEDLAADLHDAGRFVGLHFFNPVPQMPLVEIVHMQGTRPEALQTALAFTRRLDKLPLPCRSAPGFVVNRVLIPYMQEAMLAVEEGVPPEVVDEAALRFGMPMGPIELVDVVGLDICKHAGEIIMAKLGRSLPRPLTRLDALIAAGHVGRKSGQGFYRWVDGKVQRAPLPKDHVEPPDLQDRLILALVNESLAVLRERLVDEPDYIDAGAIFGAGFAPFRGGPLTHARSIGAVALRARLEELATRHGERFETDAGIALLEGSSPNP